MNFKYNITLQDYINFNKFHQKNIFSTITRICSYIIFTFAILTLNIVLIILGLIYFSILIFERKMYKAYYYSKKDLNEEIELIINEEQVIEKTIYSELTMKISEFYKIKHNKKYYFLYISKFEAIILPKRYVDEKQQERLNKILLK